MSSPVTVIIRPKQPITAEAASSKAASSSGTASASG
eukprot:CAMPEP_0180805236 /NCGR_PEP_ID=MMETSP1038_2-20121128/61904_1 /TAXON_ID=632150 /ORGANISM="Azadinium spinosum, Strain 3D9" /LENGTH=35 /DNA_ID= /DNA_START= /DNA_END= /DNA_ORIENTATION=